LGAIHETKSLFRITEIGTRTSLSGCQIDTQAQNESSLSVSPIHLPILKGSLCETALKRSYRNNNSCAKKVTEIKIIPRIPRWRIDKFSITIKVRASLPNSVSIFLFGCPHYADFGRRR
jgi:hypothetical protein